MGLLDKLLKKGPKASEVTKEQKSMLLLPSLYRLL